MALFSGYVIVILIIYLEVRDVRGPWCNDVVQSVGPDRTICFAWLDTIPRTVWLNDDHGGDIVVLNTKLVGAAVRVVVRTYGKVIRS